MKTLKMFFSKLRNVAACAALFATVLTFAGSPDINLFYSDYFAGVGAGVAAMMFLDDEEDD